MIMWEEIRHQVAIAGQVTDGQTGKAIGRALVKITGPNGADQTRSATDGHFHFLDLPDGQYTVAASLPGAGSRYGEAEMTVTVSRDAEEIIIMAVSDIALPPTTLEGQITGQDDDGPVAVVMAEVRIKGSGERVFSDGEGKYLLTGLEKGRRTVIVSARGYQSASQTVELSPAGTLKELNFVLQK